MKKMSLKKWKEKILNKKLRNDLINLLDYYEAELFPRLQFKEDKEYLKEQIEIIKKELKNG